ncbi:hypothetical protein BB561_000191 [Smittium simulii]|uniref:FCP1 homology domain-containing protein n=1 Tax=Smittium simulii TaxID=133385 RepID=A0A2T9Z011_9FUNG|nr:hypothetical protein BB561_000191 [Smittium simulii]
MMNRLEPILPREKISNNQEARDLDILKEKKTSSFVITESNKRLGANKVETQIHQKNSTVNNSELLNNKINSKSSKNSFSENTFNLRSSIENNLNKKSSIDTTDKSINQLDSSSTFQIQDKSVAVAKLGTNADYSDSYVKSNDSQEEIAPKISIDIGTDFIQEQNEILLGSSSTDTENSADNEVKAIIDALTKSEEEDLVSDDLELRSEIASPRNNIASASSEKLITRISGDYLLSPLLSDHSGRKCLVLDLDETLVHSSFKPIDSPDFIVPVTLYGQHHDVFVSKRPNVDKFLLELSRYYEIVVFTASLSMYADPVMDLLDIHHVITHRLFRESCSLYNMNYVKDLSRLGRPLTDVIIIDNSPASYLFHPQNAISVTSWFNDPHDSELLDILPFLISLSKVDDVAAVLNLNHNHKIKAF